MKDAHNELKVRLCTFAMDARTTSDLDHLLMIHTTVLDTLIQIQTLAYANTIVSKTFEEIIAYCRSLEYFLRSKIKTLSELERRKNHSLKNTKPSTKCKGVK